MSIYNTYYVHRSIENYYKSGIYRLGRGKYHNSLAAAYQAKKNEIKNNYESKKRVSNLENLESQYEKMLFGTGADADEQAMRASMQKALESILNDKYSSGFTIALDNLVKGNAVADDTIAGDVAYAQSQIKKAISKELKTIDNTRRISKDRLKRIITELQNMLNLIYNEDQQFKGISEIKIKLEQKYQSIESIKTQLLNILNSADIPNVYIKNEAANINFLNDLIDIIGSNLSMLSSATVQGDLGEWIAPWITTFTMNMDMSADELVKQFIDEAISHQTGGGGSFVLYRQGEILKESKTKKTLQDIKETNEYGQGVQIRYHVNKTDAEVLLPNEDGFIEYKGMSIKNYSSFSNMSLVSNTPLGTVLDYNASTENLFHLANILVEHNDHPALAEDYQMATDFLKHCILQAALQGYTKENRPHLFMAINSTNKQVRIYDTDFLLAQMIIGENKNAGIIGSKINIDNKGENYAPALKQDTTYPDTEEQMAARTKNVIEAFKQQKIHVSLSLALKKSA